LTKPCPGIACVGAGVEHNEHERDDPPQRFTPTSRRARRGNRVALPTVVASSSRLAREDRAECHRCRALAGDRRTAPPHLDPGHRARTRHGLRATAASDERPPPPAAAGAHGRSHAQAPYRAGPLSAAKRSLRWVCSQTPSCTAFRVSSVVRVDANADRLDCRTGDSPYSVPRLVGCSRRHRRALTVEPATHRMAFRSRRLFALTPTRL
jgi:hypothetical protein